MLTGKKFIWQTAEGIKLFIAQLMHTNYKILRLLKQLKLWKLLQHVSVHIKPSSGSHIQCLAKITCLLPMYQYWCCQCYGGIRRHNTDVNNDTHIGTRYV